MHLTKRLLTATAGLLAGLCLTALLLYGLTLPGAASSGLTAVTAPAEALPILYDFEAGIPTGFVGFADSWDGSGSSTTLAYITATLDLPYMPWVNDNTVVSVTYDIAAAGGWGGGPGYGGVTHDFAPSQDWSGFQGFSFWYSGSNSGGVHQIELKTDGDGGPGASNRFVYALNDDFSGWRFFAIPFSSFVKRTDYNPGAALGDSINLAKMWGYSVLLAAGASGHFALDQVGLYGYAGMVDFEAGIPAGFVGFADSWDGSGSSTTLAYITATLDLPYMPWVNDNTVVSVTYDIAAAGGWGGGPGYGGVTHDFAPSQDWSGFQGFSFWYSGSNSGGVHQIELKTDGDGGPGASNRFVYAFNDDFSGWRFFAIPFSSFVKRTDYNPGAALGDSINLAKMWGYSIMLAPGTSGQFYLDQVAAYGGSPEVKVAFSANQYNVLEGETAIITVTLNMAASVPVTVTYASADGSAAASSDYEAITGTLHFPAGTEELTFEVKTTDDGEDETNESVQLSLSGPVNAQLGANAQATLVIIDNDAPAIAPDNLVIIDDFESGLPAGFDGFANPVGFVTWGDSNNTILVTTPVAVASPLALPGAVTTNTLLQADYNIAGYGGYTHAFENVAVNEWVSMDWSSYVGVSFWFYGANSGGDINIDIFDNRTTTGDSCERFTYIFKDNVDGWRFFAIPFSDFQRKGWQPGGAPDDGLTLTEVWGYGFGFPAAVGAQTNYLDNVALVVRTLVIDDFESGLPAGFDGFANPVGFVTWGDSNNTTLATLTVPTSDPLIRPGQITTTTLLQADYNIAGWGGYTHAFENVAVNEWVSMDWSSYVGVSFWLYGANSGGDVNIDIFDNRTTTGDSCERFTYIFKDNFDGWRFFAIPFSDFQRKGWQPGGAPNDGLTLTEVWGYGFGFPAAVGAQTNYLDNVFVYGNTGGPGPKELTVGFSAVEYRVGEGDSALITVTLNQTSTLPVTVTYATAEATALVNRDYLPASGTLHFEPGQVEAGFTVNTRNDGKYEGDERVVMVLSAPINALLSFQARSVLRIEDDEVMDPLLLDDFEGFHRYQADPGIDLSILEVSSADGMALPGQGDYEQILAVDYDTTGGPAAGFWREYAASQDWSGNYGLSFWFYGANSGDPTTVQLFDNQLTTTAQTEPVDWMLVWSDEFDSAARTTPDINHWKPEIGDGTANGNAGWGNSEKEFYTDSPDNASMNGAGHLVISATQINTATSDLVCWYGPCEYTSARLISTNRFEVAYGRVEARLKLPFGQGLWPAFWLLGNDIGQVGWPASGEIDIMENVGYEPAIVHGALHGPGYSGGNPFMGSYVLPEGQLSDDFHVFAIEWQPDQIRWFIDDTNYFTVTTSDLPVGAEWVYDHPFFVILNVAVGGVWPGDPDATSTFPQTMEVDYVRVYQSASTAERFEASFVDDFSGWQQETIPFSQFQRSASQPDGAPDDGLTLSEVWGYGFAANAGQTGAWHLDQVRLTPGQRVFLPLMAR